MNKHFPFRCGSTANFAKLMTLSSVLTAAVTWSLQHFTAVYGLRGRRH